MRRSGQRFLHDQTAFTLLEVLVALSIIGITLTTLFGAQSQSLSLAIEANAQTTASMLANLKMAQVLNAEDADADEGDFGEEHLGFRYKVEVDNLDAGESELLSDIQDVLKRVTISIFMDESDRPIYELRVYKRLQASKSSS